MNSEQFEAAKKYVDTPSGRIHYAEAGEGQVALFVHGVRRVQRLFSDFAVFWQGMRMKRHINELPDYILKDIGWPDAYAKPLVRHGSVRNTDAGSTSVVIFQCIESDGNERTVPGEYEGPTF